MSDGVRAARVEPAADHARTSRAEHLAAQGRFAEAERMLAATLAASPGHEQALATLVRIQMTQGRAAQASQTLDSAVSAGAKLTAGLMRLRGGLMLSQARFDEAVAMFREAVAADPADASAAHALAVALAQTGAHEDAIDAARSAIANGHDPVAAGLVLGRALWENGRAEEAEREFRRIVALQPAHAGAHTSLVDAIWLRPILSPLASASSSCTRGQSIQSSRTMSTVRADPVVHRIRTMPAGASASCAAGS